MNGKNSAQAEQHIKMTQTPIPKLILTLGLPTTISMLVTNIYNMADTYFVSQLGTSASGAVGIVFGLMAIIQAFGFMLGQGGGSILSRSLGAGNVDKASRIASKSFFTSLLCGGAIGIFGLMFIDPLMRLFGSTETILPYARTYGICILIAAPIMTASFTMNNIIRYEGRATYAMVGLTIGGILNIFGDWLLMSKLNMGIIGAGIATAASQFISFCILLSVFLCGKTQCRLSVKLFLTRTGGRDHADIISTGFPSLVRQGLTSLSTTLLNRQVKIYGDPAIAAMSIVSRITFLIFAVGLGIGQGFQPVSAYNYGAKKYSRVKKAFYFTWLAGSAMLSVMIIICLLLSGNLIGMFRDDPDVIRIGTFALRAQLISLILHPISVCTNMLFQSIGKRFEATLLSSLRNGLAFIPTLFIMSALFGLTGVELSQPIADGITFIISIPFAVHFLKNLPPDGRSEQPADS